MYGTEVNDYHIDCPLDVAGQCVFFFFFLYVFFFFFNDTATTEIYTLSLHDALPISGDNFRGGYQGIIW